MHKVRMIRLRTLNLEFKINRHFISLNLNMFLLEDCQEFPTYATNKRKYFRMKMAKLQLMKGNKFGRQNKVSLSTRDSESFCSNHISLFIQTITLQN